jgi:hypothetical protein
MMSLQMFSQMVTLTHSNLEEMLDYTQSQRIFLKKHPHSIYLVDNKNT